MEEKKKINLKNVQFICWLVGFIDAEGSFQTYLRSNKTSYSIGYGFQIGLSNKDLKLIELLQKALNIGKIYLYEEKKEAKLDLSVNSELTWLIENIFSKYPLLTQHQATRCEYIKKGLLEKKKVNSPEEFKEFIDSIKIIPDISFILTTLAKNTFPAREDDYFKY